MTKFGETIKANKTAKQANLIRLLNPILRGWTNYHSHVVAKETFGRNDAKIWSMLWQWATRRHPTKGSKWVKKRYFKTIGARHWVFAATEQKEDGTKRELILLNECDTPIHRHVKIKSDANPHDPQWEQLSVVSEFDVPIFTFRDGVSPRLRGYRSKIYALSASLIPTPH